MKITESEYKGVNSTLLLTKNRDLFIMALTICIFVGIGYSMIKEADPNEINRVVESFVNASKERKVTRVESYYYSWNVLTRAAITEDRLVNKGCDFKVISYDPDVSELVKALEKFDFAKTSQSHFDLRIGFIFYKEEQEILRVFFAKYADVVVINGVPLKNSSGILKSLVPYLPVKAYFDIYQEMKEQRGILLPVPLCCLTQKVYP